MVLSALARDSGKRWTEIEYVVRGDEFHASFGYPDETASAESMLDRRRRIVAKHFGDKQIIYPPMPDDPDIMEFEPEP